MSFDKNDYGVKDPVEKSLEKIEKTLNKKLKEIDENCSFSLSIMSVSIGILIISAIVFYRTNDFLLSVIVFISPLVLIAFIMLIVRGISNEITRCNRRNREIKK